MYFLTHTFTKRWNHYCTRFVNYCAIVVKCEDVKWSEKLKNLSANFCSPRFLHIEPKFQLKSCISYGEIRKKLFLRKHTFVKNCHGQNFGLFMFSAPPKVFQWFVTFISFNDLNSHKWVIMGVKHHFKRKWCDKDRKRRYFLKIEVKTSQFSKSPLRKLA